VQQSTDFCLVNTVMLVQRNCDTGTVYKEKVKKVNLGYIIERSKA